MHIKTNFTSGEMSPLLDGRVDIEVYSGGCKYLENFIVKPYGGAHRRPGTYYVNAVKDSAKITRLIPFEFSTTQAYVLEFGDHYIRFYKDGGRILKTGIASWLTSTSYVVGNYVKTGTPSVNYYCVTAHTSGTFATDLAAGKWVAQDCYEIYSPYAEADVLGLQYCQDADTMYITSFLHPVYKLTRTAHDVWAITEVTFIKGAYRDRSLAEIDYTLTPSGTTGSITVTSSANLFVATDVCNSVWRINTGTFKITAFTSATQVTATVVDTLADTSATTDWEPAAWSPTNGYPGCCTFQEQRLFLASTYLEPQGVWGSQSEDYENMEGGTDDGDALAYIIASGKVNVIRWITSGKELLIGTTGGVFSLDSGVSGEPISPTNVRVRQESSFGCAAVIPYSIGNYLYYLQNNGRTMRELSYSYDVDSYKASDATILSEHITKSTIVEMAYQESPDNVLWCVRSDGDIATMTREVDQKVTAWSHQITDGYFNSIAVIPNGEEEQVWVIVERTINGNTYQYVEYFKPFNVPDDQEDCFYVDCGLTYDSTPADNMSGLGHLEGEDVSILADGAPQADDTVASGALTLKQDYSVVHIGLKYTSKILTLNYEGASAGGNTQGLVKRIVRAIVRLYKSLGCEVGNESEKDVVSFRDSSMHMNEAPPLFTGDKEVYFPSGYDKVARVEIIQDQPLPLNVLAIITEASMEA
jgi:hypothetical protein